MYVGLFLQQVVLTPCGVTLQSCCILLWSTEMELGHPSKTHAWMIQSFINWTQMRNLHSLTCLFFLTAFFPFLFQSCTETTRINSLNAIHFLISAIFVSGLWLVLVPLWKCLYGFPRGFIYSRKKHAALELPCEYG